MFTGNESAAFAPCCTDFKYRENCCTFCFKIKLKKNVQGKNCHCDASVYYLTIEKMGPQEKNSSPGIKFTITNSSLCIFKFDMSDLCVRLGRISEGLICGD